MADAVKPDEVTAPKAETWFDGKPKELSAVVKKLEGRLITSRFLDGVVTRIYYGESALPIAQAPTTLAGMVTSSVIPSASGLLRALGQTSRENLVKSVVDTAASMIVRRPGIRVITTGGSWKKQVSARRASRLLTGVFTASGFNKAMTAVFRDSCRCVVAAIKWNINDQGKITCDRVLPHTIVWNPAEGPRPRNLFLKHGIPRSRIARQFKDKLAAQQITADKLPPYKPDVAFHVGDWGEAADDDQIEVCEGWRLPQDGEPGRYVMTSGEVVLVDEAWDIPVHQVVVLRFGESYSSMAGDPLGRQVLPFQRRLNRMNQTIDENASKCAAPKLAIPKGSEIVGDPTNQNAERYYYNSAGGPAQWLPGQMLPAQFYEEKDKVKSAAFEGPGVSQAVATSTKPAGLNSGRAQREHYDQASGRMVNHAETVEDWCADAASSLLALMRHAYGTRKQRIQAPNTALIEEIYWDEMGDLKEDEVQVMAFITSAIPTSPAARAETLAEWVEAGAMSARRATRWQANPDMARLEDEESAAEDLALKLIDQCLVDGKQDVHPEPVMGYEGLQIVIDSGGKELMKALTLPDPPPMANMELLRRLIAEAQLMLANVPAPAPPASAPAQPVPAAA